MQSSSQIITTNKPTPSCFYRPDALPIARPTNSVRALKWKTSHSMDLLIPSSPGGLPTLSMTTNSSWLPWGRVAMPFISPLMSVPLERWMFLWCRNVVSCCWTWYQASQPAETRCRQLLHQTAAARQADIASCS